jgi:CHAT domain-containing protein/tetratricopeptide (TPR) repeat protein
MLNLPYAFFPKLLAVILLSLSLTPTAYSQNTTDISEDAELYRNVVRAIGKKNYTEAIELGRKLIERTDKFEQVYARIVEAAKAAGQLEQAKSVFESLLQKFPPNPRGYYGLGLIYSEQKNYAAASEYHKKCISAQPEFPLPLLALVNAYQSEKKLDELLAFIKSLVQANPNNPVPHLGLGYYYFKADQTDAAEKEIDIALSLNSQIPYSCYYKTYILLQARRRGESLVAIAKCLPLIEREINEEHKQAFLNLTLAIHKGLMNFSEAVRAIDQSLELALKLGDKKYYLVSLGFLAEIRELQGNYSQALVGVRQASEVSKEINDFINLRRYPWRMGNIHFLLGDLPEARRQFEAGLQLSLEADDKEMRAIYLSRIGDVFAAQNQPEQAIAYYTKLTKIEGMSTAPAFRLFLLDLTYPFYLKTGEYQKAQEAIEQARVLAHQLSDAERKLRALNSSGELRLRLNDPKQAIDSYKEALQFAQERNSPLHAWTASAGLAAAYRQLNQPEQAREYYLQAIKFMEDVRARLTVEEERAGFFNDKVKIYKDLIAVLIELHGKDATKGYEREAFDYAERARGRAFLDLLAEGKVNVEQTLAADLLEQRQQIDNNISRLNSELMKERSLEPAKQNKAAIEQLEKERGQADRDYANWRRELQRRDPHYAALKYPEPISLAQTQQLLDERTVLLSYSLGETSSYLFAVSRDGFRPLRLDGSAKEIGQEVEQLVTAIIDRNRNDFRRLSVKLYERLIQPAGELLKGKSELIIVADGALHRLPFEVLLSPSARAITQVDWRKIPYLVRDYAISYAPSASVLEGLQDYHREAAAGQKELLAFADPVYDAKAQAADSVVAMATRSARGDDGQWLFKRLAHSKDEADGIAKLFPKDQADVFLGARATEENAKRPGMLGQYRIIHFAAHGLINQNRPRFSGIVLSLPRKEPSEPKTEPRAAAEDGILQAYEVFNMKLNADLVVLSACETGLGKEVNGEGLMGLTRAFIYAGTPSVIVSLWKVDDEKSADLMIRFYTHLKAGKTKSEALRQAQLDLIEKAGAPYFWAPFILIGRAN